MVSFKIIIKYPVQCHTSHLFYLLDIGTPPKSILFISELSLCSPWLFNCFAVRATLASLGSHQIPLCHAVCKYTKKDVWNFHRHQSQWNITPGEWSSLYFRFKFLKRKGNLMMVSEDGIFCYRKGIKTTLYSKLEMWPKKETHTHTFFFKKHIEAHLAACSYC